jgi:hypothetical protein
MLRFKKGLLPWRDRRSPIGVNEYKAPKAKPANEGWWNSLFVCQWSFQRAGVEWPGGDAALLGVLGFVLLVSLGYVTALRRRKLALA